MHMTRIASRIALRSVSVRSHIPGGAARERTNNRPARRRRVPNRRETRGWSRAVDALDIECRAAGRGRARARGRAERSVRAVIEPSRGAQPVRERTAPASPPRRLAESPERATGGHASPRGSAGLREDPTREPTSSNRRAPRSHGRTSSRDLSNRQITEPPNHYRVARKRRLTCTRRCRKTPSAPSAWRRYCGGALR